MTELSGALEDLRALLGELGVSAEELEAVGVEG